MVSFDLIEALLQAFAEDDSSRQIDLMSRLDGQLRQFGFDIDDLVNALGGTGDPGLAGLREAIGAIDDDLAEFLGAQDAILEGMRSLVLEIGTDFAENIGEAFHAIGTGIATETLDLITDTSDAVKDELSEAEAAILDSLDMLGYEVAGELNAIGSELMTGVDETLANIGAEFQGLGGDFKEVSDQIASLIGLLNNTGPQIAGMLQSSLLSFLPSFFELLAPDLEKHIGPLIEQLESNPEASQELLDLTAPGFPAPAALAGVATGFALPLVMANALNVILTPPLQRMLQYESQKLSWALPTLGESALASRRGHTTAAHAAEIGDKLGFHDEDIVTALKATDTLPAIGELTAAWHREEIGESFLDSELDRLGIAGETARIIKALSFPIPGISDLISMAVREVFSPEIAESFGQFDEIPAPYLEWTRKQGLTEEWARNYWAAHWTLPSARMGFEMLHRGVIDREKLENLMVALDIMPGWREDVLAISFRRPTRVDIRRFYALGVIDEDQVRTAYTELGYTPEVVEWQTQFVLRSVAAANEPDAAAERDLTKTDILRLYQDGIFDRDQAAEFMADLGYSEPEYTALLDRVDIDLLLDQQKLDIQVIVNRVKSGDMDLETAQTRLEDMGLTEAQRTRAINDVVRNAQDRDRLPTKKELFTWLESDAISVADATRTLQEMGYADRWITLYLVDHAAALADDPPEDLDQ